MEEEKEETKDKKCSGKLNFYVPLLSTRRHKSLGNIDMFCATSQGARRDTSNRVPFSWEQTPGKPKEIKVRNINDIIVIPPPKLPPGRWHPPQEVIMPDTDDKSCDHNDGSEGDDGNDATGDVYSDILDLFSLSESIDIESYGCQPSSYMIERFLPDAKALAASSAPTIMKNANKKFPHLGTDPDQRFESRALTKSYSSTKGCGLKVLFPWRIKHNTCSVKSPVKATSMNVKSTSLGNKSKAKSLLT